MGKLKNYEIDALTSKLEKEVKEYNKDKTLSDKQAKKLVSQENKKAKELLEINNKINDLEEKRRILSNELRQVLDINGFRDPIFDLIGRYKKEYKEERGYVNISKQDIKDLIILNNGENFNDIIEAVKQELGI